MQPRTSRPSAHRRLKSGAGSDIVVPALYVGDPLKRRVGLVGGLCDGEYDSITVLGPDRQWVRVWPQTYPCSHSLIQ